MGHLQAELSALSQASQLARQRLAQFEDPNHEPGLPDVSVERHRDVLVSEISQAEMLLALLEPGITALDGHPAKEKEAQVRRSGWAFDTLLPYLMRDWTGTAELEAAKSLIDAALRKIFPDPSGRTIAVAGCGAGGLLTGIPPRFEHIVGFDLTLPILAAARHLLDGKPLDVSLPRAIRETGRISLLSDDSIPLGSNVAVVAMDAFDTAFADGALDCVITSFLIDLVPEPNKLAAEIYRILSAEGVWINYGPSGPLKARWRFDNAETAAFFETVGFTPIHSEAHRTTYLDLSRDCPSWSTRSHMCYLTAGRKTKKRQEISKAPARIPTRNLQRSYRIIIPRRILSGVRTSERTSRVQLPCGSRGYREKWSAQTSTPKTFASLSLSMEKGPWKKLPICWTARSLLGPQTTLFARSHAISSGICYLGVLTRISLLLRHPRMLFPRFAESAGFQALASIPLRLIHVGKLSGRY